MELPLRLFDKRKEERLEPRLKKAHIVMVNFRRDMTDRSVAERSQASHAYNTDLSCKLLWRQTPTWRVKFSARVEVLTHFYKEKIECFLRNKK
jgi:hypothetical protein